MALTETIPPPGLEQAGRWRLEGPLAAGGFGCVHFASDAAGRRAAVKLLRPELVTSAEQVGRLRREAEAIAAIGHPNVVELYEQGELPDGRPYLAMELLDGEDLETTIARRGALSLADIEAILTDLCDALDAAHARGIIHRDVKPSNVVITDRGAVLLDFGLAKLLEGEGPELTASRCALGTPASMSPEQIQGRAVDPRTDVYGLGALAFEMLTGSPPFADASPITLGYLHLHGRRPRPGDRRPLPAAVDEVVVRAMDREPERRWPGAGAFLDGFRRALGTAPAAAGRRLAARVEILAPPERMVDPDDALLDTLDAVAEHLADALEEAGFSCLGERGQVGIYARPQPGADPGKLAARLDRIAREAASLAPGVEIDISLDEVSEGADLDAIFLHRFS